MKHYIYFFLAYVHQALASESIDYIACIHEVNQALAAGHDNRLPSWSDVT